MINYYALLELPDFASEADIKAAHRRLSKKYHPDLNNGDKYSEEMFKKIQDAYERLRDPAFRKNYDDRLRGNQYDYSNEEESTYTSEYSYTSEEPSRFSFWNVLRKVPITFWVLGTWWVVRWLNYSPWPERNDVNVNMVTHSDNDSILKLFANDSLLMHALAAQPYDTGATIAEVRSVQGKPTLVERTQDGDQWFYGNSKILFRKGRVVAYDNRDGNLYVKDSAVGYK